MLNYFKDLFVPKDNSKSNEEIDHLLSILYERSTYLNDSNNVLRYIHGFSRKGEGDKQHLLSMTSLLISRLMIFEKMNMDTQVLIRNDRSSKLKSQLSKLEEVGVVIKERIGFLLEGFAILEGDAEWTMCECDECLSEKD